MNCKSRAWSWVFLRFYFLSFYFGITCAELKRSCLTQVLGRRSASTHPVRKSDDTSLPCFLSLSPRSSFSSNPDQPQSSLRRRVAERETFFPVFVFLSLKLKLQDVSSVSTAPDEAGDHLPEDFPHLLQPDFLGESPGLRVMALGVGGEQQWGLR